MKKIFLIAGILTFGLAATVSAHGMDETGTGTFDSMMKMDQMLEAGMMAHKDTNCASIDSKAMLDKGEGLMEMMLGGDAEKHEKMEELMETEGGEEFHDMMHIMMGRMSTGCFSDDEEKFISEKHTPIIATERETKTDRNNQLVFSAISLIGGIILGIALSSFLKR